MNFDDFWAIYPRKVKKKYVRQLWDRLKPDQKVKIGLVIHRHIECWEKNATETEFIPHPSSWINGERWDDVLEEKKDWKLQFIQGGKK